MLSENKHTSEAVAAGDGITPRHYSDVINRPHKAGFLITDNPAYLRYHQIHKSLVGPASAELLQEIKTDLELCASPPYLYAAGWAAAEAALVGSRLTRQERQALLDDSERDWQAAIEQQQARDSQDESEIPSAATYRMVGAHIYVPVFREMVNGYVKESTLKEAYTSTLKLTAQLMLDQAYLPLDKRSGHIGLTHEKAAELVLNHELRPWLIAVPTIARADTGYFYPGQTHDIQLIEAQRGKIVETTPIEVKSKAGTGTFARYDSVVVSASRHLGRLSRRIPAQAVYLLLKEQEGTLSDIEAQHLHHVFKTVQHLELHHVLQGEDVSAHCPGIHSCAEFDGWQDYMSANRRLGGMAISKRRSRRWQFGLPIAS